MAFIILEYVEDMKKQSYTNIHIQHEEEIQECDYGRHKEICET
jgi:hypothetical protein